MRFDHFIYGGRDLEPMRETFQSLTGIESTLGGRHPGLGTRNALASLGEGVYFELLACDAEQSLEGNMGGRLQAFPNPRLFAYMLKASNLESVQQTLARHGVAADLFEASRNTPQGETLRWRLVVPKDDNPYGDSVPKFIDWLDTPHPSGANARGCRFESFELGHPQAKALGALLHDLQADIDLHDADRPTMRLKIATPKGSLTFTGCA